VTPDDNAAIADDGPVSDDASAGQQPVTPAPDVAENEGDVPRAPKPKGRPQSRNRRHGRRR
jgi:hypothetical protein